jgi:hypothetical protein
VLVNHQPRILNRGRKRAPNLRAAERIIAGLCSLFMNPARVLRSAIVLKPSTLLHLHHLLTKRKYRMLMNGLSPPSVWASSCGSNHLAANLGWFFSLMLRYSPVFPGQRFNSGKFR